MPAPALVGGLIALALLATSRGASRTMQPPSTPPPPPSSSSTGPQDPKHAKIRAMILRTAVRYGVDPHAALTFAWLESRFNPNAAGDLDWATRRGGELYRKNVLDAPHLRENPARNDPKAWHSYGLFQLLAPYHVQPTEHPDVLRNPIVNASRGVLYLRKLLQQTGGDVDRARLLYTGGSKLSPEGQAAILDKLHAAQREVIL